MKRSSHEAKKKKQTADRLWNEGIGLYNQNKYTDALGKLKESLTHWSDQSRQDYVQKMETAKASAKKLRDEGEAFQNQGKLQDAVNKYKQSVKTWPNPALEEHIAKVEDEIRRIEEKKACAKKNRDEGAALQQQNRLSEALDKFNASYACWPTPEMDKHIKDIKNYLDKQQAQAGAHPADTGSVSSQPPSAGTDTVRLQLPDSASVASGGLNSGSGRRAGPGSGHDRVIRTPSMLWRDTIRTDLRAVMQFISNRKRAVRSSFRDPMPMGDI